MFITVRQLVFSLMSLIFCAQCMFPGRLRAADIEHDFKEPPLEYATRPLWFWNGVTVTEEGIVEQMQKARDACSYGGFGILPFGKGFNPEYLTEDYFKVYGVALEKAKELGMKMSLYDECGFPSGGAGARNGDQNPRFLRQYPDHTIKRLDKSEKDITGPALYSVGIPEGKLMSVVAMEMETKKRVDLTPMVKDGEVNWSVPSGNWKVMIFCCVKSREPIVDYLEPESVKLFIEMIHQQYYNRFEEYFGDTIEETFFDEPTMYRAEGRMWTGAFNEKFIKEHGFDPAPYYPALWYDIGPETQAARNYLFGFRSKLYATGFTKVIQDWCDEHGIAATGHQDQEEVLNQVSIAGDLMLCFKHLDVPGVDMIVSMRRHPPYKVISSAAYNWDKARVMSETYGAMGEISWKDIYHVAMEQYTKGVNQLIPHAVWYDDTNVRFPPDLSWRHPLYAEGLPEYNKFMGRLNVLLQNHGRHVADIGVLYPIATLQAGHYLDGALGKMKGGVRIPEADYRAVGDLLIEKIGRDYTFIHPEVLNEKCTVEGSTLMLHNPVNYEAFNVMIMPGHKTIYWSNLKKIKEFYDTGGKVIATGALPYKSAEFGHDRDVVATIETMFQRNPEPTRNDIRVSASSTWQGPGHGPELVIDGSKETRWNAKSDMSADQWLEIDFGQKKAFDCVAITEALDRITAYSIQYFDGNDWVDCAKGTTLGEKQIIFDKVIASKVRLYIHTVAANSASIAEFSVALGDTPLFFAPKTTSPGINRNEAGGMAVFLEKPTTESLRDTLDSMQEVYDVEFETGKELRYIHKVKDGTHIYYFANLEESTVDSWIELRGKMSPEVWNPHTGDISKAEYSYAKRGSTEVTKVKLELQPEASLFVVARQ